MHSQINDKGDCKNLSSANNVLLEKTTFYLFFIFMCIPCILLFIICTNKLIYIYIYVCVCVCEFVGTNNK